MNRREFISSGIVATGSAAFGSITRSLLGGREREAGKSVPYDSEVEWLESTGPQYIDTGMIFDQSSSCELFGRAVSSSAFPFFGSRFSSSSRGFTIQKYAAGYFGGQYSGSIYYSVPTDFNWHRFCLDGGILVFDGQIVHRFPSSKFTTPTTALLFTSSTNGTPYEIGGKMISWCKIKGVGDDYEELVSVRFTNEDGETEGAMYGKVSGKLFRNVGAGSFIIGPDV